MVNRYELVLILGLFLLLIYMAFRIRALFKNRSKKFFHGFWFWVVPWLLFLNAIPFWLCRPYLPRTVLLVGLLATLLDFFYFYGLKSKDSARTQWLSLLWLVPILAVGLGARMGCGPNRGPARHHGPALVWTDRIYNPEIYFFLDRQTRGTDQIGEAFEDPKLRQGDFFSHKRRDRILQRWVSYPERRDGGGGARSFNRPLHPGFGDRQAGRALCRATAVGSGGPRRRRHARHPNPYHRRRTAPFPAGRRGPIFRRVLR